MILVLDADGVHASTTTDPALVADPLPQGWSTVTLDPEQAAMFAAGGRWDPATGTVTAPEPTALDPLSVLAAALDGLDPDTIARLPEVIALGAELLAREAVISAEAISPVETEIAAALSAATPTTEETP